MESSERSDASASHHHKKMLHAKRSFGKQHPRPVDSPAYDASEEDNDPLTDDGASHGSVPATRHQSSNTAAASSRHMAHPKPSGRVRHQLASSLVSDDGVDSPTYDGDIESSTTAGLDHHHHHHHHHTTKPIPSHHHSSSSTSTLNTPLNSDLVPTSSIVPNSDEYPPDGMHNDDVNAAAVPLRVPEEPAPVPQAQAAFNPAGLTQQDIQDFVRKAIEGETWRKYKINKPPVDRPVRVYADGVYDLFHFGHSLQLRQAKLSFPSVYLLVGVCSDELVKEHKARSVMTHAERCEAARHCRWVDEIVPDAPWVIDADFLDKWEIDYVAHDEDPYPTASHDDCYSFVKSQGKFIPTRRTPGVSTSELLERIVSGYRHCEFDDKLVKMGHPELKASGSDYDDSRPGSRTLSRSGSPIPSKTNATLHVPPKGS